MSLACSPLLATCFKHATSKLSNLRHKSAQEGCSTRLCWEVMQVSSHNTNRYFTEKKTTFFSNLMPQLYIITSQCPPPQTTHFCQNLDSSMSCQERTTPLVNRTTSLPLPWLHLMKNDPFSDVPIHFRKRQKSRTAKFGWVMSDPDRWLLAPLSLHIINMIWLSLISCHLSPTKLLYKLIDVILSCPGSCCWMGLAPLQAYLAQYWTVLTSVQSFS